MIEATPLSVRFTNRLQDHLEARRILYRQGTMAKVDKGVALLLFGFGLCLVFFVGLRWWTVVWFPLAIAEWFDLLTLSRWRTKLEFQRNPKYQEEYQLTFTPQRIHFRTASIDATLQWTHYEQVIESQNLFLLMYGKALYTLIPKRCFHSSEEVDRFRTLLTQMVRLPTVCSA